MFDAVEQARVEAIGSNRMAGMGDNLETVLADRLAKSNYRTVTRREDAPIHDAVALLVRERLTGRKTPAEAGPVLDLWRDFLEEKGAVDLDKLPAAIEDQQAFAKLVRNLLTSMEMAENYGDNDTEDNNDEDNSSEDDSPRSDEENQDNVEEEAGDDAAFRRLGDLGRAARRRRDGRRGNFRRRHERRRRRGLETPAK